MRWNTIWVITVGLMGTATAGLSACRSEDGSGEPAHEGKSGAGSADDSVKQGEPACGPSDGDPRGAGRGDESVRKEPCDPESWSAAQADVGWGGPGGEPTYDEQCRPIVERSCESACDCKFVNVAGLLEGASVAEQAHYWPAGVMYPGGCQYHHTTVGGYAPIPGQNTLTCTNGLCTAFGPNSHEPCASATPGCSKVQEWGHADD